MIVDAPQLILGGIVCKQVVFRTRCTRRTRQAILMTFKLRRYPICRVIFAIELITSTPIFEDVNQKILVRTLRRQIVIELTRMRVQGQTSKISPVEAIISRALYWMDACCALDIPKFQGRKLGTSISIGCFSLTVLVGCAQEMSAMENKTQPPLTSCALLRSLQTLHWTK